MYFFKDDTYYLFNGKKLDVENGYPRVINDKWAFCSENLIEFQMKSAAAVESTVQHNVCVTLVASLFLIRRLHWWL